MQTSTSDEGLVQKTEELKQARGHLSDAMGNLAIAHREWSECVTKLHMAELKVRETQQHMNSCYFALMRVINGS